MTPNRYLAALCILSCLAAHEAVAGELPRNWPMAPSELERRFAHDEFRIREVKGAGAGVTGASKLELEFADGAVVKVKWKDAPGRDFDGWNNSPRKEMAAYAIQRWIIGDENDYVVPTIVPRCIPMKVYEAVRKDAKPTLKNGNCKLGVMAVWLGDVEVPDEFWYPKRFETDPKYARSMADFNLLTYLYDHRDGRGGNLLLSTVPGDPRVFAIDNGVAFDPLVWNYFVPNWYKIRVPWLNRDRVERLRSVGQAELDALGVVAELQADKDGQLRVVPPGPNLDPKDGVRVRGGRVQFGLTREEIRDVGKRIARLLERVDSGKQPVR